MLFAIDSVNANETLLPNITLGFDIRDTCFSDQIGLGEAVDVINGSRDSATPTVGIGGWWKSSEHGSCTCGKSVPNPSGEFLLHISPS